ncbi:pyridoxal phosphate-dependent aminotransferase [Patescibacteria group bacterium]|nr:pyridoxal phosphate-dependent aminotransferase [Patescibacteria group bacterium]MBU1499331.1 pyridoxal phosphate-dependent aminotransferase [Patescibacteria group bacterium]
MYRFTQRTIDVPNSGIGYMMRYAAKYNDVISLGQGTPLFPTPSFIYDYLYQRSKTDKELGMYSSPNIDNELKEQIRKQMQKIYGFKPKLREIYLTTGGIGALYAAMMAFLQKGDEVIYFDPSYPLHLSQIHLCQAKPVFVSYIEEKSWQIDLERLKKSITPKTKAVILTNPNNPTGTVLSETEIKELAEIILKHNLILILDEAYEFLVYEKKFFSPLKIARLRKNIVLCKSFSKEFAMTGWRIGYLWADKEIVAKINDVHVYFSIGPATPSIVAATKALADKRGEKAMVWFKKKFTESRKTICERLDRLPKLFSYHKPEGAYYTFPKYLGFDIPAFEFAKKLIDEARVITIPGTSSGPSGDGHLRMSFAADPTIIHKAFDRLDNFAKEYNLN